MTRKATEDEIKQLFNAVDNNNVNFIKDFFEKNKDMDINTINNEGGSNLW